MANNQDNVLNALFEEYKQLSSSFDKHIGVSYSVPPVVLTIITGFFFFASGTSATLIGFGVTLGAVFLVVWLGLIQSMVNHIGVHLVRLEIEINRILSAQNGKVATCQEPLSFYRRFVGQGFHIIPGFQVYFSVLSLLVVIVLIPASITSWMKMTAWQFSWQLKALLVGMPAILMVLLLATMRHVDRTAVENIRRECSKAGFTM